MASIQEEKDTEPAKRVFLFVSQGTLQSLPWLKVWKFWLNSIKLYSWWWVRVRFTLIINHRYQRAAWCWDFIYSILWLYQKYKQDWIFYRYFPTLVTTTLFWTLFPILVTISPGLFNVGHILRLYWNLTCCWWLIGKGIRLKILDSRIRRHF